MYKCTLVKTKGMYSSPENIFFPFTSLVKSALTFRGPAIGHISLNYINNNILLLNCN